MNPSFYFTKLLALLESELQKSKNEIFIAAPYSKIELIEKLKFPIEITSRISIVCRWRLEDLMSGATDIEVYPYLRDKGIAVRLHPSLHAKYYRFDKDVILGSANLTLNGLMSDEWGNLEALCRVSESSQTRAFEEKLLNESILVNDQIYEEYSLLKSSELQKEIKVNYEYYWPEFSSFDEIWAEHQINPFSKSLAGIRIPTEFNHLKAKSYVKIRLREFENIRRIENFIGSSTDGRRFGEVRALIRDLDKSVDETSVWQNLMSLLLDLYPDRYHYFRPNYTEIILAKI